MIISRLVPQLAGYKTLRHFHTICLQPLPSPREQRPALTCRCIRARRRYDIVADNALVGAPRHMAASREGRAELLQPNYQGYGATGHAALDGKMLRHDTRIRRRRASAPAPPGCRRSLLLPLPMLTFRRRSIASAFTARQLPPPRGFFAFRRHFQHGPRLGPISPHYSDDIRFMAQAAPQAPPRWSAMHDCA